MNQEKTNRKSIDKKEISKIFSGMLLFVFIAFIPMIFINILNPFLSDLPENDTAGWLSASIKAGDKKAECKYWEKLLEEQSGVPIFHLNYIHAKFDSLQNSDCQTRDTNELQIKYIKLSQSSNPKDADIGKFGLAVLKERQKEYEESLKNIAEISNQDLQCVQLVKGMALEKMGRFQESEMAYIRELEKTSSKYRTIGRLSKLYRKQRNWSRLNDLLTDPETGMYVPKRLAVQVYIINGQFNKYVETWLREKWDTLNRVGFMAAIVIALIWILYLRNVDVFEPEKFKYLFLTVICGAFFAFLTSPLYHLMYASLDFMGDETLMGEFCLYFLFVGPVEELAKIIPLFLMIRFTKQINESVDYIIYAAAGALGFAVLENIFKFHEYRLFSIDIRGMVCVVSHMFSSSLVGYGIVLAKYRNKGYIRLNVAIAFVVASLLHGLYDFVLSDVFPAYVSSLWLVIVGCEVVFFALILNNSLNQSEFFKISLCRKTKILKILLGIGLTTIMYVEYVALAYYCGPTLAKSGMMKGMGLTVMWVWTMTIVLSTYHLHRGIWLPLSGEKRRKLIDKLEK